MQAAYGGINGGIEGQRTLSVYASATYRQTPMPNVSTVRFWAETRRS
jgi:hypothetical protein